YVESLAPTDFVLEQNYPNPFNPSTSIKYGVAVKSHIVIKVFNALGSEVATLVNGVLQAGTYEIGFDASTLPSGTYFYRLQAGNFVETKKMVLVK
ncbi:MAG: T9SS type A sorting domain-containing protein, partial [Promethearchaeota archaeon]